MFKLEILLTKQRPVDANNLTNFYGVVLNPQKDRLITFAPQDTIIVLAES